MGLEDIYQKTGKVIHIGLEPEPGCYLETTGEVIDFFKTVLWPQGTNFLCKKAGYSPVMAEELLRKYVGICFDTCHPAIQHENLEKSLDRYLAEGIRISKIHLSAALKAKNNEDALKELERFCEPTYLHQVVAQNDNGIIKCWEDLPHALAELHRHPTFKDVRIHFHVPLFWKGTEQLGTTASALTPGFFNTLKMGFCQHLEIETYTFDVLPEKIRPGHITESISKEYAWVLEHF
ncbi:MAG: hypothetical protein GKR87_05245 [Kiritimatiellae bacterium]|nr:hypothetical protein [Kiritimatiellia bacterium]